MKTLFAAIVLALALVPVAAAAAPIVPLEQQGQMEQILASFGFSDLGFIPTKAPASYVYESNVVNSSANLITFQDGTAVAYFTAQYLKGSLSSCGKGSQISLKIGGVTVYSKNADVWRCVKGSHGKVVKLIGSGTGLSREDLGTMVVSAKLA